MIGALGARAILQTFRRPQLFAPIIVFPTLLLAIQTGGAGRGVDLPGFPQVNGFLDFILAGAMIQSTLLAGNSGGIALAVDIEMGFTDRLLAAPISRYAIVLGRLAGTAVAGRLLGDLVHRRRADLRAADRRGGPGGAGDDRSSCRLSAVAFGGIGAAVALRTGKASVVQGLFPLVFVVLFLSSAFFPSNLMLEPAATIAKYNPLSFIVEGVRDPVISSLSLDAFAKALGSIALIGGISVGLSAAGAAGSACGREARRLGWRARPRHDRRALVRRARQRAAAGAGRRDPRGAGADDLLPRPDLGVRPPDPAAGLRHARATRAS